MPSISVVHNIEVAHRLYETGGKCEQIHGHSMLVTMRVTGNIDAHGLLEGLNFTQVKRSFRRHLDDMYDHHLLLNKDDPWAHQLLAPGGTRLAGARLPGLQECEADPTTENIAKWIWTYFMEEIPHPIEIQVQETATNFAVYP